MVVWLIAQVWWRRWPITLIAMALMAWHSWEIARGRQARFYALIELGWLIQLLGLIAWLRGDRGRAAAWILPVMALMVTIHPFGWIGVVVWGIVEASLIVTREGRALLWKRYCAPCQLVALVVAVLIWFAVDTRQQSRGGSMHLSVPLVESGLLSGLSREMRGRYLLLYLQHLGGQLGIWWVLGLAGLWWAWRQRDRTTLVIGAWSIVTIMAMVVLQWYMFHTRYVLFLFPVVFLLGSWVVVELLELLRRRRGDRGRGVGVVGLLLGVVMTMPLRLWPQATYLLDRTSPQHDFQAIYAEIPDGRLVVTAFPILCYRYYRERGDCVQPIAINLVADGRPQASAVERYTWEPYLTRQDREQMLTDDQVRARLVVVIDSLAESLVYLPELIEQTRREGVLMRRIETGAHRIERYHFPLQ
jgi:hypothetical protein